MLNKASTDKIGVFVTNYNKSLDFYKNILGLAPAWEDAEARNAGFKVGFNLLIIQENSNIGRATGGFIPYFTVSNIQAKREKLINADIECSEIQDIGDMKLVHFADPDNNRCGLFEPTTEYLKTLKIYFDREIILN